MLVGFSKIWNTLCLSVVAKVTSKYKNGIDVVTSTICVGG